ncbi:hypothetical protein PGT21_026666 [Puccinia graminis f. sp. tritici]|uniref:Uncharacterized protein n=1 Tax=Puccinia graminis f. sp. tritici TaxID=56615 RepID=A0A5B0QX49_PUCGR|nr:hypothetical protein PGT21_026666 [Puccinia graminis f. sp. tritici]
MNYQHIVRSKKPTLNIATVVRSKQPTLNIINSNLISYLKPNPISSPSITLSLFPFSSSHLVIRLLFLIPDSFLPANQPQPHSLSILKNITINTSVKFVELSLKTHQLPHSSTSSIFPSSTSSLIDFVNLLLHWITSV